MRAIGNIFFVADQIRIFLKSEQVVPVEYDIFTYMKFLIKLLLSALMVLLLSQFLPYVKIYSPWSVFFS